MNNKPYDPLGFGGNFIQAGLQNPRKTQPNLPQKKQKGFWTDQISTGTGIGGALGGAAAGAAAGSIIPGLGTAVGGIVGALLGGGLGSAGGEVAENRISGDSWDKNVLREGLIGGATSLPIGAGFKLARAGVKGVLGREGGGELVQQAGLQTIPKGTLNKLVAGNGLDDKALDTYTAMNTRAGSSKLARNADNMADGVLASQSGMTASQARKMGLKPVDTFRNIYGRTGLTRLDDMAEVGRNLTGNGRDSILDVLTRSAFEDTRGVQLNSLRKTAQSIMDDGTSLLGKSERNRVLENMKNADIAINGGASGSLSGSGDALTALDQANAFRGLANSLSNGFNITPKDKQLAKIYNGVASDIERSLYGARGVSENVPLLAKAGADDILFKAQAAREAGNETQAKAFEQVANEVRNVKSIKDLRTLKKDWVDISKIDKATAEAEGARTLTGQQFTTNVANNLSPKAAAGAIVDANAPSLAGKVKDIVGAIGPRAQGQGIVGLSAWQALGRLPFAEGQSTVQPIPDQTMVNGELAQTTEEQPEEPSVAGYTESQIRNAIVQATLAGDSTAVKELENLYSLLPEPSESKLSSSAAQKVAQSANGEATINQLEQLLTNAGGGKGAVSGGIAGVLGNIGIDNNAKTYNDLANGSVAQIAKALGETGALSDTDIKSYGAMLPRLTDTPEVAANKIAALRQRLAIARQNTIQYNVGDLPASNPTGY